MKRGIRSLVALLLVLIMTVAVFGNTAMAAGWGRSGGSGWNPWGWFRGEQKETEEATEAAAEEATEVVEVAAEEAVEPAAEPAAEEVIEEDAEPAAEEAVEEAVEPVEEAPAEEVAVEEAPADEAVEVEAEIPDEEAVEAEKIEAAEQPVVVRSLASANDGVQVRALAEEPPVRAAGSVPAHSKTLTDNHDGTYTLALNVTGEAEKKPNPVNVIVVFDTSSSMNTSTGNTEVTYTPTDSEGGWFYQDNLYGLINGEYHQLERTYTGDWWNPTYHFWYNGQEYTGQRYTRQQGNQSRLQAAEAAVNELAAALLAYNGQDGNPDDTVEMALVDFANTAEIAQNPTTSYPAFSATVNSRDAGNNNRGTNWEAGLATAKNVDFDDNDPTYVIFVSDGNPTFRTNANGYTADWNNTYRVYGTGSDEDNSNVTRCYNGATDDAKALVDDGYEFYTIGIYGSANRMRNLTTAAGADSSHYYSADDTAALQAALAAILAEIEMAGIGNVEIDDGTTNQVTTSSGTVKLLEVNESSYKYWRAGGEYGTGNGGLGTEWTGEDVPEAELVNGEVQWDLSSIGVLENGVTYTVTFDVYPSQQTYDYIAQLKNGDLKYSELPAEVRQYLIENEPGVSYTLLTNTVATLSYDDTRDEAGQQEVGYTNPDPVATSSNTLTINKKWVGADAPNVELPITVLMDGDEFHTAKLSSSGDWKTTASISVGIIKNGQALTGALGHDFSFAELDSTQYRWELDAPTVRPMLVDGTMTMLVKVDEKHPAPAGATTYSISGSTYYVDSAAGGLTATNYRRSYLDVAKVVESSGPKDPNAANVEFDFAIKVVNALAANGTAEDTDSDYYVWFSVADSNNNYAIVIEDGLVTGNVTRAKEGDAYTGYYYMPSGTEIHVNMKDGYSIRFLNLPSGSTYKVTESATMPNDAYSFKNITVDTKEAEATVYTEPTVEGTVVNANNPHTVTVRNTFTPYFYVYHTSDNTIEKISFADQRVTDTYDEAADTHTYTFDLTAEVKTGDGAVPAFLYGGYYKGYGDQAKASNTQTQEAKDTAIRALDYGTTNWANDTATVAAKPYTGNKATAWKAANVYTEKGTEMQPVPGTVYYLKEVPNSYLRPYIQIVYDKYDDNKLVALYQITAIDDANYTEVGFKGANGDTVGSKISAAVKITANDGTTIPLTTKGVFDGKSYPDGTIAVPRGYMTAVNTPFDAGFAMQPYFKTPDGVKVFGVTNRTVDPGNGYFVEEDGKGVKPGITTVDATNVLANQ